MTCAIVFQLCPRDVFRVFVLSQITAILVPAALVHACEAESKLKAYPEDPKTELSKTHVHTW